MLLKKLFLCLTLPCWLLVGCASPKMSEEVTQGKFYFEKGYYKRSFNALLPAAAAGNPEAEYAVGYMYYYGYGVVQDTVTGKFWINKSAETGYAPAVEALRVM